LAHRPADAAWQVMPLGEDVLVRSVRIAARISPEGRLLWRHELPEEFLIQEMAAGSERILLSGVQRGEYGVRTFLEVMNADDGKSLGLTIVDSDVLTPGRFNLFVDADGLTTVEGNVVRRWLVER
jgi:hypothetical protein